jgi:16S rRNA (adenine1518-N6/adenine1519-N6)-dimethyltransferase
MDKLAKAANTIEIIKKYDFTFQKRYGQNFLTDTHVIDKIMDAAGLTEDDYVIEIGPGIGSLTQYLAERAGHVTAIEIDRELIPILNETLKEYDNVRIINNDVLKMDLSELIGEENGGRPAKVVANLPYYITTPIVMSLLESHVPLSNITVMVQKEVADRMQAGPGSKDYGALSLAVGYYSKPQIAANVPPNCFIPRPKVGSAVICLDVYDEPKIRVSDEALMFRLIRASFNQRRKTLVNSISNAADTGFGKQEVADALQRLGLAETVRGEALTLEQFALLTDCLLSCRNQ